MMEETTKRPSAVDSACSLLAQGRPEDARRILGEAIRNGDSDPLTRAWQARVDGQIEGPVAGLEKIQELLVTFPDRSDIWIIQMQMLLDAGFPDLAREAASEIRNRFPGETAWGPLEVDALELLGDPVGAEDLLGRLLQDAPADPGLLERKNRLRPATLNLRKAGETLREARDELTAAPRLPLGESFLEEFRSRFSGREGVHALQCRQKTGWGYRPVRKGLDNALIKRHLAGDSTLGTYLVRRDNSSNLLVFDLDVDRAHVRKFEQDPLEKKRLMNLLVSQVKALLDLASPLGLPLLVEFSGFKGFHLWAFSARPVPAKVWRALGAWMLGKLPAPAAGLHWEVFPKQDSVGDDGLGNLVKLPLGVHRKSGRRSWFVNPATLKPLPDQEQALLDHPVLQPEALSELLGNLTLDDAASVARECHSDDGMAGGPGPAEPSVPAVRPGGIPLAHDSASASPPPSFDLAVRMAVPKRFPPEVESLFAGCPVVWDVAGACIGGKEPGRGERHVLISILTALGEEGRVCLHQLLNQAPGYSPDLVNREIRAVPPLPMSCGKVRRNVPHLALPERCACSFRLPEGTYPSPVVLAGIVPSGGTVAPGKRDRAAPALCEGEEVLGTSAGIDRLMKEFDELRKEIARLAARERLLRSRIDRVFEAAGTSTIRTELGEYKRLEPSPEDGEVAAPEEKASRS